MPDGLLSFNAEINEALLPHIKLLTLLHSRFIESLPPRQGNTVVIGDAIVPVLGLWNELLKGSNLSREQRIMLDSGILPLTGDLSIEDQSRVAHWITIKIPNAQQDFRLWMSSVPFIHAITIIISSRHRSQFIQTAGGSLSEDELLKTAWNYQCSTDSILRAPQCIDINRECVAALEERMFTRSAAAGIAGYYQWGLDAGDHQEQWWPWRELPSHWYHDDTPDFDDDDVMKVWKFLSIPWILRIGSNFIYNL